MAAPSQLADSSLDADVQLGAPTGALMQIKSPLLLLALGVELLEVGPQIGALVFVLDAGEHHLGAGNLGARILDVFVEHGLVPGDAGILVRVGVIVALDGAGLAALEAVEHGADLVLGVRADRMAGQALLERVFARGEVLRRRAARRGDDHGACNNQTFLFRSPLCLRQTGCGRTPIRQVFGIVRMTARQPVSIFNLCASARRGVAAERARGHRCR